MSKFLIKRILSTIPTIIIITIIGFLIMHASPGDIVTYMLGIDYTPQAAATIRHTLGLDKPLYVQYFVWIKNLLHGDLGISLATGVPVLKLFFQQLPYTLFITVTAFTISFIFSIFLGVVAAIKRNSILDYILSAISFIGASLPDFWLCYMVVMYCMLNNPKHLYYTYIYFAAQDRVFLKSLPCFIFPILILILMTFAPYFKFIRNSMLEVINLDYITHARSLGLGEIKLMFKHSLRNALLPFITYLGLAFPTLITGTLIIEAVFGIPGIGRSYLASIFMRDYTYLMGAFLLISLFVIIGNLLADILYALADPRIKYN